MFPDKYVAARGMRRAWFRVTEPVLAAGLGIANIPPLTDDHAPIERLMARLFLGDTGN